MISEKSIRNTNSKDMFGHELHNAQHQSGTLHSNVLP